MPKHTKFRIHPYSPRSVAVDISGNVYVADTNNYTIRKITPAAAVSTFAGTAGSFGSADGTSAAASFGVPYGVAVDGSGNVYVRMFSTTQFARSRQLGQSVRSLAPPAPQGAPMATAQPRASIARRALRSTALATFTWRIRKTTRSARSRRPVRSARSLAS
ncbi:MAG: hypothetical protein ACK5S1_02620 [bacterium]